MSAQPKWLSEKERLISLPLTEKRLYKNKEYVTLENLAIWPLYVKENKGVQSKKPNEKDLTEFQKAKINPEQNEELSKKVSLFRGDITKLEIDAIVNAANSRLKAGGGVDGAIHRAAGPLLQEECNTLGGCPTGEAKVTGGYMLPASYVIHTVGPQDGSAAKLESCYKNCFALLDDCKIRSVAFPCISTGIYGFPNRLAAHIALRSAREALEKDANLIRVIFCTFLDVDVDIYETLMQLYFPLSA